MAFTFDQVFAADPSNPSNVAQNAAITIFAPGDGTMTPLAITDPDGAPLANPITVNANGFASAFAHATLDRVAWAGGGFTGFFTSYEGMKAEATAARTAAETAASDAAAAAEADLEARITAGQFRGEKGEDGANVLPTDTAIKAAIENTSSETRGALKAAVIETAAVGKRSSDGITSWWCTPRAHYDAMRQRVYFTGNSRAGLQHVGYFDLREKTARTFPLGAYEADDHNTPAILIEDDKPPIVTVPRHGQAANVKIRIGTAPHALDTLGPEITVPFAGLTSYAHIMRQTGTSNVAVLTRDEGASAGLAANRSTDWGQTWGTSFRLFGAGYVTFRQVGNTVYGATAAHPTSTVNGALYGFKIDALTGDITSHHSGTVIGNLWTNTTVISSANLTIIRQNMDTDTPTNTTRLFDVGPSGSVAVMDFHKSTPQLGGTYKVFRKKAGGTWTAETLIASGVPLGYNESSYVGGMQFGATDDEIYLCRENAGTWTLERWTATANVWSYAETIETRTDGRKLGRPILPRKGEGAGHLIVGDYHQYSPDNYYDYMADQTLVEG